MNQSEDGLRGCNRAITHAREQTDSIQDLDC